MTIGSEIDVNDTVAAADRLAGRLGVVRTQLGRVIFGQERVIAEVLVCLLSGGHALLVGVPGLGKTLLVQTLGTVLGLSPKRVQFTPDLMPADITGSEILEEDANGGRGHVLATQNPIEQEGTYPLPEAQLDRFMLQIELSYPDEREERAMLLATTGAQQAAAEPVLRAGELVEAQTLIRRLPVGERVVDAILRLVRSARPESSDDARLSRNVAWGPGPRAAQALMLACRARALLEGRLSPSIDDVAALAQPVLRHRMALTFAARAEGATLSGLIDGLVHRLG